MDSKETIARNVKAEFTKRGLSTKDVADIIESSQQLVCIYLSGTRGFGRKTAKVFADAFGFNMEYLLTGEGELLRKEQAQSSDMSALMTRIESLEAQVSMLSQSISLLSSLIQTQNTMPFFAPSAGSRRDIKEK